MDILKTCVVRHITYLALSLLGQAYATSAGVDSVSYALALGESEDEGENAVTKTFDVLPDATDENIQKVETGLTHLGNITEADRRTEDVFKMSMYYSAHLSLITKKFDSDGLGGLTAEELADLSAEDAAAILASLANAENLLSASSVTGANEQKAAEKISAIQTDIDGQSGADDVEKLQSYLSSQ